MATSFRRITQIIYTNSRFKCYVKPISVTSCCNISKSLSSLMVSRVGIGHGESNGFCTSFNKYFCASSLSHKHINLLTKREKHKKSSGTDTVLDSDDEEDSEVEEESEELFYSIPETDPGVPDVYKHLVVHSARVDTLVSKALKISKSQTEKVFYKGRFMYKGKTLEKKAKKIPEGGHVDVIAVSANDDATNAPGKLLVQRVKILKYMDRKTRSGKPVTLVRAWRKPFLIDKPE